MKGHCSGEGGGASPFWEMDDMETRPQTLHKSLRLVKDAHIMNFNLFHHA